jgi:hypothetical protein
VRLAGMKDAIPSSRIKASDPKRQAMRAAKLTGSGPELQVRLDPACVHMNDRIPGRKSGHSTPTTCLAHELEAACTEAVVTDPAFPGFGCGRKLRVRTAAPPTTICLPASSRERPCMRSGV